jgi:Cu/Ag efflux protein CusF
MIMKTTLIPTAFAVLALSTFAAFAANSMSNGVIKSIDATSQTITLEDGKAYVLPKGFDIKTLKVGEKVAVDWTMTDGKYVAASIKPAA